jgi:hypothetical protein
MDELSRANVLLRAEVWFWSISGKIALAPMRTMPMAVGVLIWRSLPSAGLEVI